MSTFVGNINQSVESLVKTSHLLAPFPEQMIDSAFFDRFHAYIPGWEIPKMRPEYFTNRYGLIVDYLAEFFREMRKRSFADAIDKFFKLGNNLNQRDVIAVRSQVGAEIARGLANYASSEARLIARKPSSQIEGLLGYSNEPEMIHRTNLVLA